MNIQLALQDYFQEIQDTAEKRMSEITLQDIVHLYYQKAYGFEPMPVWEE